MIQLLQSVAANILKRNCIPIICIFIYCFYINNKNNTNIILVAGYYGITLVVRPSVRRTSVYPSVFSFPVYALILWTSVSGLPMGNFH